MKFTALMPLHNEIHFNLMSKAINSVLQNKLIPNEFIIIVDGFISSDKKLFLIKKREVSFVKIIFFRLK
jgi:glycosyltransferase involved in cell wall biosynthesis